MEFTSILYDKTGRIATVTFNRPERMNAFNYATGQELRQALEDAASDDQIRAIIVTGAGRAFCSGADVDALSGRSKPPDDRPPPTVSIETRLSYPLGILKPIIAAVNGTAVGLGVTLMAYYDIRIAAESARMALMYPRRGISMEGGVSWLLPKIVGLGKALELAMTGRFITAREAFDLGLVNHVVPDAQLMDKAREIATEIAENCSPVAVAEIKREIYQHLAIDLDSAIRDDDKTFSKVFRSEDFKEGIRALMQKRPPRFPGR